MFIGMCPENPQRSFTAGCSLDFKFTKAGFLVQVVIARIIKQDFGAMRSEQFIINQSQFTSQCHLRQHMAENHRADNGFAVIAHQQVFVGRIAEFQQNLWFVLLTL